LNLSFAAILQAAMSLLGCVSVDVDGRGTFENRLWIDGTVQCYVWW